MKLRTLVWRYKDASRFWWKVELKQTEDCQVDQAGEKHFYWNYKLSRDGGEMHFDSLLGQYDMPPRLDQVMLNFSCYISAVVIGASKYGKQDEEGV